jgi:hypothetical protein
MSRPPKVNAEGQKELEKTEKQIQSIETQVKSVNFDETRTAKRHESEPQTKLAQSEMDKAPEIYLKPRRSYPPGVNPKNGEIEKFNEKFRDEYNKAREYVEFVAENYEVIGESPTLWIKKFPGTNLEEWVVPVNKPVWAPRYVKDRLQDCGYTVFKSTQSSKTEEGINYNGYLEVQERKNRLDAREPSKKRSIYMGNYKIA